MPYSDNQIRSDQQESKVETKEISTEHEVTSPKLVRLRLIPIWLRIILVICLLVVATVLGLIFGYSVLGDGDTFDALKWSTWQHMLDIIQGVEK